MFSTLSTSLQQALYLVFGGLLFVCKLLVYLFVECFHVALSWLPSLLEHGVFMCLYTVEHILSGGLRALWLLIELAFSGGEILANILEASVVVGWESVYLCVWVKDLLLSILKQFGDKLLTIIQAVEWRESLVAVGLRWRDTFTVLSLSEAMIMCSTLVSKLFYISVGLTIIITIGYIVKYVSVTLLKKRDVIVQVQPDVEVSHTGGSTLQSRTTSTIHRRVPLRRSESSVSKEEVDKHSLKEDELLRERLSRLHSELSEEKDKNLCVVCLDRKREILLNPCKHYCLCITCVISIHRCPVCNQKISTTEKIYHV